MFNRKQKNRRLGREYVLDVKLRSSQVRAARTRLAAWMLGGTFAVVFGLYLVWRVGEWGLNRLVYENKSFAIANIDAQTDGVIAVDQLRRWARVRSGQNLFALDLAQVRRDLLLVSLIQSASVERVLPHTLRIRVTEREPLAQINLPRPKPDGRVQMVVYQVDAEGWVMVPMEPPQRSATAAQPVDDLPMISGLNSNEVQAGHRVESPQLKAALELVEAFEHSLLQGQTELKRIEVSSPEVIVATTDQGSVITFGLSDVDQQLRRWQQIFFSAQKQGKGIATLDLAVSNNVPASWLEASVLPAPNPKLPKPLRNKKKHV
jgi:cell division septal protein FtsQ